MSDDKIYEIPAEWKQRGFIDDAKYQEMYQRSVEGPERLLGRAGQAHRLDQAVHQGQEHLLAPATSRSSGSRTARSTPPTTASTAICRSAPTRPRSSGRATIPKDDKHITYQELHDEVCRMANILRNRNVEKGDRVTIYMPMIPEAAYAMLACARHRRGAFGGVRRLLAGLARRPHRGLQVERRHHRRRRPARRPQGSAQGQHRRRHRQGRRRRSCHRGAAHRRHGRHGSGARRLVPRGRRRS